MGTEFDYQREMSRAMGKEKIRQSINQEKGLFKNEKQREKELFKRIDQGEKKAKANREKHSPGAVSRGVGSGLKIGFKYRSPKPFSYGQVTEQKRRIGLR